MKPLGKVKLTWSSKLAYAIGLLATDGNLSKDGRHLDLTSRDEEQLKNFSKCLNLNNKITSKKSGFTKRNDGLRIQFGDVNFYRFLLEIGLTPAKSKTMQGIKIPDYYLFDFLRGHLDGDGTFFSYWDPRWRSSYMFYTVFMSASLPHLEWLRNGLLRTSKIHGHVISNSRPRVYYQLRYAKKESLILLKKIYYSKNLICLSRKRLKIEKALSIIGESL